jgi:hypothetical protein
MTTDSKMSADTWIIEMREGIGINGLISGKLPVKY